MGKTRVQKPAAPQAIDYAQAIADLVKGMPIERAAQVYDFVRFLQVYPIYPTPLAGEDELWLETNEEGLAAEDLRWEATFARERKRFATLASAARAEIEAGITQPMFNEDGEFIGDELAHDA
ncbi:MAG: hypothetical protein DCC55_09935 [Chloroflexi bacterium]|nr:MAG: hypothetical protein DCC55_09935 [Chloroflexota bacterium]